MSTQSSLMTAQSSNYNWSDLHMTSVESISELPKAMALNVDAVICERAIPSTVTRWLDLIATDRLPEGRYVLPSYEVSNCLKGLFASLDHEPCPAMTWLCNDVQKLGERVAKTVSADLLRLRLEIVTDNACAKLHVDNVVARLICTYRGPGTEVGLVGATPNTIRRVETGMPILLKGRQWPDGNERLLRHRSPPIEGSGLTRLVLVLEAISHDDILPEYDSVY